MADQNDRVEGNIAGKPISGDVKQKIQDVLKTTLQQELKSAVPTVGRPGGGHGSVHGSVVYIEEKA